MAQSTSYSSIPKGSVPPPAMRYTRYPFLFLVDTSGSTGFDHQAQGLGPQADIHQINRAIQGMLAPKDEAEADKARAAGHDLGRVLTTNDLVASDNCFFVATGVTNGDMLRGVSYRKNGATTRSLVMRSKSGTVRFIESVHKLAKLQEYSVVDYSRKD